MQINIYSNAINTINVINQITPEFTWLELLVVVLGLVTAIIELYRVLKKRK